MSHLRETTDDRFDADVLESERPVLVEFTAAWCPPCRVMAPILTELDADREDLDVVALDVDANPATAARFGVLSMPTFLLFRHGRPVAQLIGARPRRKLEAELDEALGLAPA